MQFGQADEKRVQIVFTHIHTQRYAGKHLAGYRLWPRYINISATLLMFDSRHCWEKCSPTGYEIFEKLIHVRPQRVRYDTIFSK